MPAATDRLEFGPPPQPGQVRAFALAVLAHILLMIALTWGINWNRDERREVAEAELWSSVPQQAAPRLVEAPPPPPPPPPTPTVTAPPPPPVPAPREADIALEREKQQRELAERKRAEEELQKKLEAKRKQEEKIQREKVLAEKAAAEKAAAEKKLAQQKAAEERKKQEELARKKKEEELTRQKKQEELAKAKKQQEEAKRIEAQRQENLRRMQGLANATGGPDSKGDATQSKGPSASYGDKIRARVKPNIAFTDDVPGNPTADVEVRMAPDGTITSRRILKSSGVRSWDDAVLRALDKTEVLPRDVDGRVHTPLIIEFKLRG